MWHKSIGLLNSSFVLLSNTSDLQKFFNQSSPEQTKLSKWRQTSKVKPEVSIDNNVDKEVDEMTYEQQKIVDKSKNNVPVGKPLSRQTSIDTRP